MGLDIVDLVMEVEDSFGIQIREEEYEGIRTVGDLHKTICAQWPPRRSNLCLSTATFLRLRRGLMSALGIARDRIRLETPLAELLPLETRRRDWRRLQEHLQLRLPDLRRPDWMARLLGWASCVLVIPPLVFILANLQFSLGVGVASLFALLVGISTSVLAYSITASCAKNLATDCLTIRDATQNLLHGNFGKLAAQLGVSSAEEDSAMCALRKIISDQFAIPLADIRPESRLLEDLGF